MLFAFLRGVATHARVKTRADEDEDHGVGENNHWTRGTRDRELLLSALVFVDGAALSRALTKTQSGVAETAIGDDDDSRRDS